MRIEGCKTKDRHLFVGSGKEKGGRDGGDELLETVRYVHIHRGAISFDTNKLCSGMISTKRHQQ